MLYGGIYYGAKTTRIPLACFCVYRADMCQIVEEERRKKTLRVVFLTLNLIFDVFVSIRFVCSHGDATSDLHICYLI